MDILIKNMEMPSKCFDCGFCYDGDRIRYCLATPWQKEIRKEVFPKRREDFCPLVALPEHGRLVSAEDFIDSFEDIINECRRRLSEKGEDITVLNYFHDTIVELMGYMPTVLEAST